MRPKKEDGTPTICPYKCGYMEKKIRLGAAYYPEMWEESETDADLARCKETGVNTLRIGEFAWGKMEPEEGKFSFGWLERTIDKLHAAGIGVVLCTPTCTPPRWMLDKYEEMRRVDSLGIRTEVSSRCHPCKTSPKMREKNAIIVEEMAKRFAHHPGVVGWQIDNEIFPYSSGCFCPLCIKAFRNYLKDKYKTVEELNRKWGMTRWSLEYDSFEDVQPPRDGQWRHPSLQVEWKRFHCRQIVSYVNEQADILHRYGCKNVGTDMMSTNELSYYDVNEKLDVVQFNHYNPAPDLAQTAFSYHFLRCVKDKPFWVTETQVGWNGSEFADCGYRRREQRGGGFGRSSVRGLYAYGDGGFFRHADGLRQRSGRGGFGYAVRNAICGTSAKDDRTCGRRELDFGVFFRVQYSRAGDPQRAGGVRRTYLDG